MECSEIEKIIFDALEMANHSLPDDEQIEISPNAKLYGKEGQLGSMALVALLLDIEDALLDQGIQISLSDEHAMSQFKSPFRDVPSLIAYVQTLMERPECITEDIS